MEAEHTGTQPQVGESSIALQSLVREEGRELGCLGAPWLFGKLGGAETCMIYDNVNTDC